MPTRSDERVDLEEPLQGVVVLARGDFETNLVQAFAHKDRSAAHHRDEQFAVGFRVDDETALRATELAGRANEPGVIGVVALLDSRGSGTFSGSLFVVADTVEVDAN